MLYLIIPFKLETAANRQINNCRCFPDRLPLHLPHRPPLISGSLGNHADDDMKTETIFFYIVLRAKQLCPCITLFGTYPWHPLHDYDVKPPECDVLWRTGAYHDKFSSLFLNLDKVLKNQTPGVIAFIWQIESVEIDAIKFERTQIHFLGDVSMPSPSS